MKTKITNLLDLGSDPCDDFYRFACNVANRGSSVPPAKEDTLTLEQLVRNPPEGFHYVNKFYESCNSVSDSNTASEVLLDCMRDGACAEEELAEKGQVYVDFVKELKNFANKSAFPAVTPDWEQVTGHWFGGQGWNWWDSAAYIMKDYFFLGTFHYREAPSYRGDIHLGADVFYSNLFFAPMIDTTVDQASIDIGDLLPTIHIVPMKVPWFLRNGGDAVVLSKYKELMTALIQILGNQVDLTALEKDVDRIIELELEAGRINTKQNFKSTDEWEIITVQQLYRIVPTVEWKDYIKASLQSNEKFRVYKHTKVKIPSRRLMQDMGRFIKRIADKDRRDQANLHIWRMMIMFANDFMHTGTDGNNWTTDNVFSNINPQAVTRSDNCLTQLKTFFPGVEDDLLIAQYIDHETKESTGQLFDGVKDAFGEVIDQSSWLTRRTRVRAEEKLNATKLLIGELLPNTTDFKILTSNITSDYIKNIIAIGNYKWDSLSKTLELEKKTSRGFEKEINAYYSPSFNFVRVKTGLINGLLGLGFSLHYPPSLLYGGFVAATLGHELTHGFDSNGNKFGKDGYRLDWWEKSDKEAFQERTKCMVSFQSECLIMFLFRLINTPPSKFRSTD